MRADEVKDGDVLKARSGKWMVRGDADTTSKPGKVVLTLSLGRTDPGKQYVFERSQALDIYRFDKGDNMTDEAAEAGMSRMEDPEDANEVKVSIMCGKGCGHPVLVPMRLITEATNRGEAFEAKHEVCPGEGDVHRQFTIDIEVAEWVADPKNAENRVRHPITRIGSGKIEEDTLESAMPLLTQRLNDLWAGKVATLSRMVDANPPTWEEAVEAETERLQVTGTETDADGD